MLKFLETRDWKASFFKVIPQRKICEEELENRNEDDAATDAEAEEVNGDADSRTEATEDEVNGDRKRIRLENA